MARHEEELLEEDNRAAQAFDLAMQLARYRCSSMGWHSRGWPGLLAAFTDTDLGRRQAALRMLRADWGAFGTAEGVASLDTFVHRLVCKSPFATTLMKEVGAFASGAGGQTDPEILDELKILADSIFESWGQSNILEDCIGKLRGA